jgi:hypothetical protein
VIIETTDNRFFNVRETGDANLAHVWIGIEVKRVRGAYEPKAKARPTLVRKEASRIVVGA